MIKIGLLGFDFKAPNKGCEALSYAFIEMLSDISNESMEIHVFSYGELGDIPRQYPKFSFVWHRLNMKNPGFLIKMKQIFDDCECVFDITYGDGFSDIYGKVWNANTDLAKQIAIMSKASLVLMPQTYGPFYTSVLKKWAIHLVKKADLAFSRDTQSAQEMHELGVGNLVVATDLAFALPYYKEKYDLNSSKRKVGINVSSLLWDGGHNIKLKVNYREYCRQIIKKYSEDDKTEIHIIPHVIDEDNYDSLENDSRVCKLLKKEFPCAVLAPDFKNPIEAKSNINEQGSNSRQPGKIADNVHHTAVHQRYVPADVQHRGQRYRGQVRRRGRPCRHRSQLPYNHDLHGGGGRLPDRLLGSHKQALRCGQHADDQDLHFHRAHFRYRAFRGAHRCRRAFQRSFHAVGADA